MVPRKDWYGRENAKDIRDIANIAIESYTKDFIAGKR